MTHQECIGHSAAFSTAMEKADRIAASGARVLITGETGTGKELIAHRIHAASPRRTKPFVAINCSALPAALLESELFGHVRGAFTEAHRTHEGLIASAAGGTLFLDEIADMEVPLQAKLLRFLETGEYRKIGSTEMESSDVRILSATHQNLKHMVSRNLFREDLYYRLAVLSIDMPPLRARKEDIPELAQYFLERFAAMEHKKIIAIETEALSMLMQYPWPGNTRELQNTMQKAVIMLDGPILTASLLQDILPEAQEDGQDNIVSLKSSWTPKPLWQVEKEAIDATIRHCGGNIPRAAALLQVSPSTLYRRKEINPKN